MLTNFSQHLVNILNPQERAVKIADCAQNASAVGGGRQLEMATKLARAICTTPFSPG
jgi:hypothetical protein